MNKPAESTKPTPKPEEVTVTIRLPRPLHTKFVQIAASEGKPLTAKLTQAVREHAATYQRTTRAIASWTRKK